MPIEQITEDDVIIHARTISSCEFTNSELRNYDILYRNMKVGNLRIDIDPSITNDTVLVKLMITLQKTPFGTPLDPPKHITDTQYAKNTIDAYKEMLDTVKSRVVGLYMDLAESSTTPVEKPESTKEPTPSVNRIQIHRILYDLTGVPEQEPVPVYELKVDLRGTDRYPFIKTALLTARVQYDVSAEHFFVKISTDMINGVPIQDLHLEQEDGYKEIQTIYVQASLKQLDFSSVVYDHLREVNRRLELCHKVLNSKLDQ